MLVECPEKTAKISLATQPLVFPQSDISTKYINSILLIHQFPTLGHTASAIMLPYQQCTNTACTRISGIINREAKHSYI